MSTHIIRLRRAAATIKTLDAPAPFLEPDRVFEFDDADPPALTSVLATWKVEVRFYGTSAEVETEWQSLITILEDRDSYPDGAQFVRDPAGDDSIVERIDDEGGYDEFKITRMGAPRFTPHGQWEAELRVTLEISGRKRFEPGSGSGIVKSTQTESYAYDECGLLTRTLVTEVETLAGTSAESKARTFFLTLPGTTFAYVTNGPEGANIEILNAADTKARSISIIQESGSDIPAGVGASFSVATTEVSADGEDQTIVTVRARGTGARAAVDAQKPARAVSSTITEDPNQCTATGVFVTRQNQKRRLLRLLAYTSTGGDRPISHTSRSGNRLPARHILPRRPVELVEQITTEVIGTPAPEDFAIPKPLDPSKFPEDKNAKRTLWPRRVGIAADRSGDKWIGQLTRVYRPEELTEVPSGLSVALFDNPDNPGESSIAEDNKGISIESTFKVTGRGRESKIEGQG